MRKPVLRSALAALPGAAIAGVAAASDRPAVLAGALAAMAIAFAASVLAGRAVDVRRALAATLAALAVRLVGAVAAGVILTLAFAAQAPAAIAALGAGLVGGLVVDTWAAWRTAGADREPLHA